MAVGLQEFAAYVGCSTESASCRASGEAACATSLLAALLELLIGNLHWTPCLAIPLDPAVPYLHSFLQMGNIIFPSDEGLGRSRRARKRVNYNMQVGLRTGLTAALMNSRPLHIEAAAMSPCTTVPQPRLVVQFLELVAGQQ